MDGKYIPHVAENIYSALFGGASRSGFNTHIQGKLKYVRQPKDDPDKVVKVMTKVAKESALVVVSERSRTIRGGAKQTKSDGSLCSKSSKSGDREKKDGDNRSKDPATCYGRGR